LRVLIDLTILFRKQKVRRKKENLPVKFREGDARKLPYPPDTFDVVMILGNSFGYFETVEDDLRVLKEVFRVLKPWGKILIDVADGEYLKANLKKQTWEWIDKKHFRLQRKSSVIRWNKTHKQRNSHTYRKGSYSRPVLR
jgi:D-alanine-D-alanine ligase